MVKLGEIYKTSWDGHIVRIIGFDDHEVFYDAFVAYSDSWIFASSLNKKCYFYRTAIDIFLEKSDKINYKKLTDGEHNLFRPDLCIRTCRIKEISWTDKRLSDDEKLKDFLETHQLDFPKIQTNRIWLYPFGPKGGIKKGELIEAANGKAFSTAELLKHANRLQNEVNTNETNGIGIYRIGMQKQIPAYYIGEYYDMAGILERAEKS